MNIVNISLKTSYIYILPSASAADSVQPDVSYEPIKIDCAYVSYCCEAQLEPFAAADVAL